MVFAWNALLGTCTACLTRNHLEQTYVYEMLSSTSTYGSIVLRFYGSTVLRFSASANYQGIKFTLNCKQLKAFQLNCYSVQSNSNNQLKQHLLKHLYLSPLYPLATRRVTSYLWSRNGYTCFAITCSQRQHTL